MKQKRDIYMLFGKFFYPEIRGWGTLNPGISGLKMRPGSQYCVQSAATTAHNAVVVSNQYELCIVETCDHSFIRRVHFANDAETTTTERQRTGRRLHRLFRVRYGPRRSVAVVKNTGSNESHAHDIRTTDRYQILVPENCY